jgi:hypothetical protein
VPHRRGKRITVLLHNNPNIEVHSGRKLTGPKEEEKEELWPIAK